MYLLQNPKIVRFFYLAFAKIRLYNKLGGVQNSLLDCSPRFPKYPIYFLS
jgi:hypothetical protein